jgi:hypothetical protein
MEPAEKAEELVAGQQNLRAVPRFEVDVDANLLLVAHGLNLPCHVMDLSLTGCRLRTKERFPTRGVVRVEVNFKVRGLAFRFCGMTQWTDGRNQVGIRFVDLSARREDEFLEAIAEVQADDAAKQVAEKEAAEEAEAMRIAEEQAAAQVATEQSLAQSGCDSEEPPAQAARINPIIEQASPEPRTLSVQPWAGGFHRAEPSLVGPSLVRPSKCERRLQSREGVETSASIVLINAASRLNGRILDLSPGGCRIETEERFPVGIYTRVETEFRLEGLSFRLGGVIQAIHDRCHVGIRFLDMSPRKREQLEQLIEEIEELKRAWDRE